MTTADQAKTELARALRSFATMLEVDETRLTEHHREGMDVYTISGQIGPDGDNDCAIIITAAAATAATTTVADAVDSARREGLL